MISQTTQVTYVEQYLQKRYEISKLAVANIQYFITYVTRVVCEIIGFTALNDRYFVANE